MKKVAIYGLIILGVLLIACVSCYKAGVNNGKSIASNGNSTPENTTDDDDDDDDSDD